MYVTEQELVNVSAFPSETSVQVAPGLENAPEPELEKVTSPRDRTSCPYPYR